MSSVFNCQKKSVYQAIKFIKTVLIQQIQFSISKDFIYTQLNGKTVLYQTNQCSVSTVSMRKIFLFQTIQFSIMAHFKYKYMVL